MKSKVITGFLCFISLCIFFNKQIFFRNAFYCCDNFSLNVPSKVFFVRELLKGQFPLWNPLLFSGTPFFADINNALLHPSNILYFLYLPFRALTLSIIADYAIAFFGMYVCARGFRCSRIGSVISAIAFTYSGTVAEYTANVPLLHTAVFVPWVFALWVAFFKTFRLSAFLILCGVWALQGIGGHPQITYYTVLFNVSYLIYCVKIPFHKKVTHAVRIFLFVFALCSVQLFPFIEFAMMSTRPIGDIAFASLGSLNPLAAIRFILPKIAGNTSMGTALIQNGSVYGYIGFLPLLCIIILSKKGKRIRFVFSIFLISLVLSFGNFFPLYKLAFYFIPGYGLFRVPAHMLILYTLTGALLAGFSIDSLIRYRLPRVWNGMCTYISILCFVTGGIFLTYHIRISSLISPFIVAYSPHLAKKLQLPSLGILTSTLHASAFNILFIGIELIVFLFIMNTIKNRFRIGAILAFLIYVDFLFFVHPTMRTIQETEVMSWIQNPNPVIRQILKQNNMLTRSYAGHALYPAPRRKRFGYSNEQEEELWQSRIMRPDINMFYDIPIIDGYASLVYKPYQDYFQKQRYEPTGIHIDEKDMRKIGNTSGRFLIEKGPYGVTIENNAFASPVISLFHDGTESGEGIRIMSYRANRIQIQAAAEKRSLLAVRNVNYPGWAAYVDNKKTPIEPFDTIFQSIVLPRGVHEVQFVFFPLSVLLGGCISFFGIGIYCMLWISVMLKKRTYKPY